MTQEWTIDGPRVLDVGEDGERVLDLEVGLVGGQVDVVTHDDSPTARVEVHQMRGTAVAVRWDGRTLTVSHGARSGSVLDLVKDKLEALGSNWARVSISVPTDTRVGVSTVSASALVAGVHADVRARSVSGGLTIDDIEGALDVNTVSGDIDCRTVRGPLTAKTVSGALTAHSATLPTVTATSVSGDVTLDLTNGRARISSGSVSGDVTVRAPYDGYAVNGKTASGQVVVDGTELGRSGRGRTGGGGSATHGDGALRLDARSASGNIVLLRRPDPGSRHVGEEHGQ